MNRHHPYGTYDGSGPGPRRGGGSFSSGPGPDRRHFSDRGGPSHRGRGGGRGRGSQYGGYDNTNNMSAYDQGPPPTGAASYNNYSQENYYSDDAYGASQYGASPGAGGYGNQGYGNFEGSGYGGDSDLGRAKRTGNRDDKAHDSIIEDRINRERPCRTLFIRNIKYETNSDDVYRLFEEHGDIKTFFDLISTRGMVFVTYYDIRAAERARARLQGSEISGRPIDVHYSLPRDDKGGGEKSQQLQGALQVTLRDSMSGQPIDENELRRKFQQFGDVKAIIPVGNRADSRYVEYYDIRTCDEAFDRLRHQGLQDGTMEIVFAWEDAPGPVPQRGGDARGGGGGSGGGGSGGRGRGRGGRGRGGRGRGSDDDFERRGDFNRYREPLPPRRNEDTHGWYNGPRDRTGYDDSFETRAPSYTDSRVPPAYPPVPVQQVPPVQFNAPPPSIAPVSDSPDNRLEQARQVQQLLAALKQPQGSAAAVTPPPTSMARPPMPLASGKPFYSPGAYGAPVPAAAQVPPNPSYGTGPPSTIPPAAPSLAANALGNLPPNIMALLQSSGTFPPNGASYTGPPQPGSVGTPPPNANSGGYSNLSYLQQSGKQ